MPVPLAPTFRRPPTVNLICSIARTDPLPKPVLCASRAAASDPGGYRLCHSGSPLSSNLRSVAFVALRCACCAKFHNCILPAGQPKRVHILPVSWEGTASGLLLFATLETHRPICSKTICQIFRPHHLATNSRAHSPPVCMIISGIPIVLLFTPQCTGTCRTSLVCAVIASQHRLRCCFSTQGISR
jgi:hypothetical protein